MREGEVFLYPLPQSMIDESGTQPPTGFWKDGLFSCLNFGVFHPHLCCAMLCTPSKWQFKFLKLLPVFVLFN